MSYRIDIDPSDPKSIERALKTEWLLTNGLGGYAMGTALGVNTRRYHGLLVAATKPPVGRVVALHSMIEQLVIPREDGSGGEEVIDLSTQQFVGPDGEPMLHPGGFRHLTSFACDGTGADWTWRVGNVTIRRTLVLMNRANLARVGYEIKGANSMAMLSLRPFIALRDFHALLHGNASRHTTSLDPGAMLVEGDGMAFRVEAVDPRFSITIDPQWWRDFHYTQDHLRGQDYREDCFTPGCFEIRCEPGRTRTGIEIELVQPQVAAPTVTAPTAPRKHANVWECLQVAAGQFVVCREHSAQRAGSVIAGYPWFGDWGRDTMISLPGLMLCTHRLDEARSTLLTFARSMKNGLLPNLFDDYGAAEHYNTVDASLWFVHAVHELWKAHSPSPRGRGEIDPELLAACRAIIAAYRKGTDFNIFMDADGLISAGDEGSQLTWMDAKRDGVVFTPRHGKPVEINALWFNALRCLAEMTDDTRERADLAALSERVAKSFREKFWWQERRCLHDVLQPQPDGKLRPNQVFATSLPFSPLPPDMQRAVVDIVGARLLTPYGLRTLDREDPDFRGRYEGTLFERDRAYHKGTVWPWLIGPYCEALLRVDNFSQSAKQRVRAILQPLLDELECGRVENGHPVGGCLGQLAEVYDGDPPHLPNGCPAQAWSVAEVLRIVTMIETTDEHG